MRASAANAAPVRGAPGVAGLVEEVTIDPDDRNPTAYVDRFTVSVTGAATALAPYRSTPGVGAAYEAMNFVSAVTGTAAQTRSFFLPDMN